MKLSIPTLAAPAVATALFAALAPATVQAGGNDITVYFTRHAEKETTTTTTSLDSATTTYELAYVDGEPVTSAEATDDDGNSTASATSKGDNLDEVCGTSKCAEELSDLGRLRADLLVQYFDKKGVIDKLDAVYSSHKYRTFQTVDPTAAAAGLDVVQLPEGGTELQPESTSPSECPTVEAILEAAPGSTLLVAGHSGTLYDIMGSTVKGCRYNGLGLDVSDNDAFPKDEDGKVANFGDVWKVVIKNGEAKLKERVNLQPVRLRVVERAK